MFSSTYKGIRIAVSHAAMQELMKEGKSVSDVIEILEEGDDAPRKRKKGTIEKWLIKGNKTFNAVIVRDYHELMKEECWLLIHFGKFTKKRP
jgi:predicted CopG family antitoxin